jgi:hypothetical protein
MIGKTRGVRRGQKGSGGVRKRRYDMAVRREPPPAISKSSTTTVTIVFSCAFRSALLCKYGSLPVQSYWSRPANLPLALATSASANTKRVLAVPIASYQSS